MNRNISLGNTLKNIQCRKRKEGAPMCWTGILNNANGGGGCMTTQR